MTIKEVYEKYKHLDEPLSDTILTGGFDQDDGKNLMNRILFDLWQSVKEALDGDTKRMA